MGSTGRGAVGTVYTGKTNLPPSFLAIGTGSGLTDNGILIGGGTGPFTATGALTNGQLPIGSTGSDPVAANLTAGPGVSITNGAGTITIGLTGGAAAVEHLTGDSGGQLNPDGSSNFNILGLSGSKTSGSGSTITVKSPPFSQVGASATSSLNTGEFVTAAVTRTLPASAGLVDGDLFIYACTTAGALVIQSVGSQKIRFGTLLSSAAGTITSTAIGDSVTLRFDATQGFFMVVGSIGTWVVA